MPTKRRAKISPAEVKQIMSLKKRDLPNYRIAESVNIGLSTVENHVKKLGLQLRHPAAEGMSCEKAGILGYLHGDGCKHRKFDKWYYDYVRRGIRYVPVKITYKKPRARICLEFYNTNMQVLEIVRKALQKVYGCKVKHFPKKYALFIKSARAVKDLLKYSDIGCYVWRVPREVVEGPTDVQKAYIRAFADAEATVSTRNYSYNIRIGSNNVAGLNQIKSMLGATFNIPSKLYGPYSKGNYCLTISGKKWVLSFKEKIGFAHLKKADKLAKLSEAPPLQTT